MKMFTGTYGFRIVPDQATQEQAQILASDYQDASYQIKDAHITLYHAQMHDLPEDFVLARLDELKAFIGHEFRLSEIGIYGDKFVFWDCLHDAKLDATHQVALKLSKYLNQKELSTAEAEKLNMSQLELQNIKEYGYPLVQDAFRPHITIAYNEPKIELQKRSQQITSTIKTIIFAKIGTLGSLEEEIYRI